MVDGSRLYFKIHEGPERYEILRIDAADPQPVVEVICDGSEGFSDCLTIIGDKMYFRGFDGPNNIGNKELWSVDLTKPNERAVLEEEICPGPRGLSLRLGCGAGKTLLQRMQEWNRYSHHGL